MIAFRPLRSSTTFRYFVAVGLTGLCLVVRLELDLVLENTQPFLVFYGAIVLAAAFGGAGPGMVAVALSALLADYFFVEPRHDFAVHGRQQAVLQLAHWSTGGALVAVIELLRRMAARSNAALAAAQLSRWRLALSLEAAGQGTCEFHLEEDTVHLAARAAALHGFDGAVHFSRAEFVALLAPEDRAGFASALDCAASGAELNCKYRVFHSGAQHWLRLRGRLLQDGGPRVVTAFVTDITHDENLVSQLRENHDLLEIVFGSAQVGIGLTAEDGTIVRVNQAFAAMVGTTPSELVGKPHTSILAPEVREDSRRVLRSRFEGDATPREWPVVTQSGKRRLIRVTGAHPVVIGRRRLLLCLFWDVTEERELEAARAETEQRFRTLANSSPVMIWVTDSSGKLEFVNDRYTEFFGVTVAQIQEHGWQPLLHPEERDTYVSLFAEALRSHGTFRAQARVRRSDGAWRWIESHATPRFSATGEFQGYVGASPDISAVKKAQTILRRANVKLEQRVSERTAKLKETIIELEALSYTLAHDLRSPIISIRGFTEILLEDHAAAWDAETRHYLKRIAAAGERLDGLVREVLSFDRIRRQPMPVRAVDVGPLVAEIIEAYPELRACASCFIVDSVMPRVMGNAAALAQAIAQLLDNAVKFVREGEQPVVRIGSAESPADPERVRIIVADNGIGIDARGRARVFQLFQRLNPEPKYDGMGIGLAIAKRAVERMEGTIGVDSEPGQGSRFWIELRRAAPVPNNSGAPVGAISSLRGSGQLARQSNEGQTGTGDSQEPWP